MDKTIIAEAQGTVQHEIKKSTCTVPDCLSHPNYDLSSTTHNRHAWATHNQAQRSPSITLPSPSEHLPPADRQFILATYGPSNAVVSPKGLASGAPQARKLYWNRIMEIVRCCGGIPEHLHYAAELKAVRERAHKTANDLLGYLTMQGMHELSPEMLRIYAEACEYALSRLVQQENDIRGPEESVLPEAVSVCVGISALHCGIRSVHEVLMLDDSGKKEGPAEK